MKYISFFFVLLITALFFSCKDNSTEPKSESGRIVSMTVNGTLPNWNNGTGYSLIAVANVPVSVDTTRKAGLDTASIGSDGKFNLVLHILPSSYYTELLTNSEPNCNSNLNPSPFDMKKAVTSFEIYQGGTFKGVVNGRVHRIGNDSIGTYYINYQAFSSAGRVLGNKICAVSGSQVTTFTEYDLVTNKDWTMVVTTVTGLAYNRIVYSVNGTDPQINDVWEYSLNK